VGFVSGSAGVFERVGGGDEILETQDRGERVEELGRAFLEHRAELVVGEKRTVGRERLLPAELIDGADLAVLGDRGPTYFEGIASIPCSSGDQGSLASVDEQARLNRCRLRLMQVAPAFFPDLAASRAPSLVVSREQQLEGFGEARLARSVSSYDEGESGARREWELGFRSDAAEALDRDGLDIGADRLF
jgi:hypothetical protein